MLGQSPHGARVFHLEGVRERSLCDVLAAGLDEEGVPKDLHFGAAAFQGDGVQYFIFLIKEGASLGRATTETGKGSWGTGKGDATSWKSNPKEVRAGGGKKQGW